jgi:hypothetical protein
MVDDMNPINQFHPYRRETSVPMSERPQRALGVRLNRFLRQVRAYLKSNPATVLSGIAAIAISFGLLRARRF